MPRVLPSSLPLPLLSKGSSLPLSSPLAIIEGFSMSKVRMRVDAHIGIKAFDLAGAVPPFLLPPSSWVVSTLAQNARCLTTVKLLKGWFPLLVKSSSISRKSLLICETPDYRETTYRDPVSKVPSTSLSLVLAVTTYRHPVSEVPSTSIFGFGGRLTILSPGLLRDDVSRSGEQGAEHVSIDTECSKNKELRQDDVSPSGEQDGEVGSCRAAHCGESVLTALIRKFPGSKPCGANTTVEFCLDFAVGNEGIRMDDVNPTGGGDMLGTMTALEEVFPRLDVSISEGRTCGRRDRVGKHVPWDPREDPGNDGGVPETRIAILGKSQDVMSGQVDYVIKAIQLASNPRN
ncbi:hypothetical protein ARMGADRAFT_1041035 [Armillaria gallica]|uniref:Uncharacterized protein n=1 Tax=Armillaria gallica TaxID=47427 RepID=A0A2H3CIV3_ARMGA|nr:hypothetical protein ARMGADRAFT_1041035 [Armillaria gallica]